MFIFRKIRYILLVAAAVAVAVFFQWNGRIGIFPQATAFINGLIADAGGMLPFSSGTDATLNKKLEDSMMERARLLEEVADTREDVRRLEAELDMRDSSYATGSVGVVARVVGRDIGAWHREVIVDAGAGSGVREGFIALTGDGLAGRVTSVTTTSATVQLVTGNGAATSVAIRNKKVFGIAYGDGTGAIKIRTLPSNIKIKKGDVVATSGYGGNYPEGLPVGIVTRVEPAGDRLAPVVTLRPAVDMSNLFYLILTPSL